MRAVWSYWETTMREMFVVAHLVSQQLDSRNNIGHQNIRRAKDARLGDYARRVRNQARQILARKARFRMVVMCFTADTRHSAKAPVLDVIFLERSLASDGTETPLLVTIFVSKTKHVKCSTHVGVQLASMQIPPWLRSGSGYRFLYMCTAQRARLSASTAAQQPRFEKSHLSSGFSSLQSPSQCSTDGFPHGRVQIMLAPPSSLCRCKCSTYVVRNSSLGPLEVERKRRVQSPEEIPRRH